MYYLRKTYLIGEGGEKFKKQNITMVCIFKTKSDFTVSLKNEV